MSDDFIQSICAGILGTIVYLRILWMFGDAAFRGVFSYRLGEIYGKPARVIGGIGLLGMVSFVYLGVGIFLDKQPPFWPVAGFFLAAAVLMVLGLCIWVIFRFLCKLVFKQ